MKPLLLHTTAKLRLEETTGVGQRPWGIAISPDGRRVHAANSLSNSISMIAVESREVVATTKKGEAPWRFAISKTGDGSATALYDDAAGDSVPRVARRTGHHVVRVPVDQEAGAVDVKERMMATTLHGDPPQNGFQPSGSVGGYLEVREISGVRSALASMVRLAARVEMISRGSEAWSLAFPNLMHVDSVRSGRETSDFHEYFHVFALRFEVSRTDDSPCVVAKLGGRDRRDSRAARGQQAQSYAGPGQGGNE